VAWEIPVLPLSAIETFLTTTVAIYVRRGKQGVQLVAVAKYCNTVASNEQQGATRLAALRRKPALDWRECLLPFVRSFRKSC